MTHDHDHDFLKTVMIALTGWFLYVISDVINKLLTHSYPVSEILALSYLAGLCLIVPYIVIRYGWRALFPPQKWKWHVARGVSGALGGLLGVHALQSIPLADFYGIIFLTPLLLCLLSHFILKERIGKHRITCIVIGFIGVIILAGPQFAGGNIGFIFAGVAVIFSAMNGILVRKIGPEKILMRFAFYVFTANTLLNLPIMLAEGSFKMPAVEDMGLFLAIPPIVVCGLLCYSISFSRVRETAMIAPFHYSQMIGGVILGYFMFGDEPTARTLIGAAIIIGAGMYMIWREHVLHKASVLRNIQRLG
jgi:S-adenosylmethionine uptake transporter